MIANKAKSRIVYRMLGLVVGEVTGGALGLQADSLAPAQRVPDSVKA